MNSLSPRGSALNSNPFDRNGRRPAMVRIKRSSDTCTRRSACPDGVWNLGAGEKEVAQPVKSGTAANVCRNRRRANEGRSVMASPLERNSLQAYPMPWALLMYWTYYFPGVGRSSYGVQLLQESCLSEARRTAAFLELCQPVFGVGFGYDHKPEI